MSFIAKIEGVGSFNASMGVVGPSGVVSATPPLIYDSTLKNISIDLTAYATESWVDANYYSITNPAGYITSAALSGYATEAWVGSQGYITSAALSPYLLSSTAASTYQPIGDYATNTALTNGLAGKANTVHTHDANAIVSGVIDLARIPIIPSQIQVVSTQSTLATLTPEEQAQITGAGVLVTTTDGNRYVYSGSGSKTDSASYVKVADITPDWTEISNKPAFGTASLQDSSAFLATPAVAGVDGQVLSTNGTSSVWIDNFARTLSCSVRNETGSTVTKGTIVYLSGASGNKPLIQKAIASSEAGSSRTFGIVSADIQTNQNGEVVSVGELVNVNTLGLTEGVSLWLSPTTAGAWTTTKPAAPNHAVFIGTVVRAHQTQGVVEVRIQNGFELSELHDVSIPSPSDNDVVVYESATSLYKGKSISTIIGGTPATESWVQSQGYLTAPYNPFDQTLNTTSEVAFRKTTLVDGGIGTIVVDPYWLGTGITHTVGGNVAMITALDGFSHTNDTSTISVKASTGITFPDNTVQTTAAKNIQPPADINQYWMVAWNLDDYYPTSMTGAGVMYNDGNHKIDFLKDLVPKIRVTTGGVGTELLPTGIKFPDGTVQETASTGGGLSPPADQTKPWLLSWDTSALVWSETGYRNGMLFKAASHGVDFGAVGAVFNPAMRWTDSDFSQWMEVNPNGLKFPDGTTQTTAYTGGGGNPFNQSLNTTDSVVFATIDASRDVSIVKFVDGASEIPLVQVRQDQQLATLSAGNIYLYDSSFGVGTSYAYNGIFFNDGSSQNTAFVPANYLTSSQVSSTYQTISGMSAYQTISGMSDYAALASANSFTTTQSITANSASAALTVTQTGIGNSFVVNDQAGDATPFVINSAGLVGLNVSNPAAMLDIAHSLTSGTGIRLSVASGQSFNASAGLLFVNIQNTGATGKGLVIENRGTGDCLYIHDSAATDTTPFVVNNNGDCIIGGQTVTAGYKLDVIGNAKVDAIKIGGSSNLSAVNYTTTGQPATVDRTTYPNEIQVVINGVTYAMPARQV